MVEYALTQVMLENNIQPDFVLGTSVGEFAAAAVAGIISFEDALYAVTKQAQLIEQDCEAGGMLAIVYDPNLYQTQSYLHELSELAAVNFSSHFVVSGRNANLQKIKTLLTEKNITLQSLPVSYAFHSSLIDNAKTDFLSAIQQLTLKNSRIGFISCARANTLTSFSTDYFWEVTRSPIQFQNTIQNFEQQNAALYLDLGPSGTLATFVKYNLAPSSQSKPLSILTPFGQDKKNLDNQISYLSAK